MRSEGCPLDVKVAKFGGTSLSGGMCFRRAAGLLRSDPTRCVAVVSAPGKRREDDEKVTDLLMSGRFRRAWARFDRIAKELGLPPPDKPDPRLMTHSAYAASRGEAMCARLLAAYLGWRFVDAAQVIRFDAKGRLLERETRFRLREAISAGEGGIVLPGFYGAKPDGEICLFPRGGSDITGALAAEAIGAQVYENWTDVCGVRRADPRVVPDAPRIERMHYDELRALAEAGAQVIHESALDPVQRAGIPMHIRNTFAPEAGGTCVTSEAGGPGLTALAGRGGRYLLRLKSGARVPRCELIGQEGGDLICLTDEALPGAQAGWARLTLIGRLSPADFSQVFARLAQAGIVPRLFSGAQDASALRLALPEAELRAAITALAAGDL